MRNLKRILENYGEVGSLNAMMNLFGFINPHEAGFLDLFIPGWAVRSFETGTNILRTK